MFLKTDSVDLGGSIDKGILGNVLGGSDMQHGWESNGFRLKVLTRKEGCEKSWTGSVQRKSKLIWLCLKTFLESYLVLGLENNDFSDFKVLYI